LATKWLSGAREGWDAADHDQDVLARWFEEWGEALLLTAECYSRELLAARARISDLEGALASAKDELWRRGVLI
jgi:hypothetical protein